jgi:dUTP pyrophosphatase
VPELWEHERLLVGRVVEGRGSLPGPPATLVPSPPMELPFKRLDPDAPLPERTHPGDAGLDLRSMVDVVVEPGARALVPTGLAVAIPEGYAGLVLPRSGLASKHGLTMANAPGLIDAGYRGEVICAVVNLDREQAVRIARGDRIAQLVVVAVPDVRPVFVDELPPSSRGEGGFGSTGTR